MNSLAELVGRKVDVNLEGSDGNMHSVRSEVMGVRINDFYFEEKNEPILIEIDVKPLEEIPAELNEDDFMHVYLGDITL